MTNPGLDGLAHCPKIGAGFSELGRSASELRTWQNEYSKERLKAEERALIESSYPVLNLREPTREPYNEPVEINKEIIKAGKSSNLFEVIDEANKRSYTGKLPVQIQEPSKVIPLFDILDARAKSKSKSRKKK